MDVKKNMMSYKIAGCQWVSKAELLRERGRPAKQRRLSFFFGHKHSTFQNLFSESFANFV